MPSMQMCSCEEKTQRDLMRSLLIICLDSGSFAIHVSLSFVSYIAANDRSGEDSAYRLLRSLCVMIKMSTNPECLHILLQSLSEHLNTFIRILQETSNNRCHSQMATFLHNLLKVCCYYMHSNYYLTHQDFVIN